MAPQPSLIDDDASMHQLARELGAREARSIFGAIREMLLDGRATPGHAAGLAGCCAPSNGLVSIHHIGIGFLSAYVCAFLFSILHVIIKL